MNRFDGISTFIYRKPTFVIRRIRLRRISPWLKTDKTIHANLTERAKQLGRELAYRDLANMFAPRQAAVLYA